MKQLMEPPSRNVFLLNVEIDEEDELVKVDETFDVSQTDFRPVWLKDTRLSCFLFGM